MATQVIGQRIGTVGFASMYYYTVSETDTTYSLTLYGGYNNSSAVTWNSEQIRCTITGTGKTSKVTTTTASGKANPGDHTIVSSYTWSWSKTHAQQTITVTSVFSIYNIVEAKWESAPTASKSFTIPAQTSYSVQYNANGGTGAPTSQTKWHGESLTLSATTPSMTGYTFNGWATSEANASAGTVAYNPGDTYSGNEALLLYAVYELAYQKPIINGLTVERCLSDGTPDDEGLYALVSFNWSVFTSNDPRYYGGNTTPYSSNTVDTCTITVGTETATPTLSGSSGAESVTVGSGNFSVDTEYSASVAITDTQTIVSPHTTTVNGALPTSSFPMDVNASGTAVALLRPAPDNDAGVFIGDDLDVNGDVTAAGDITDGSGNVLSDKIGEDSNGDISITRNITAGGNVEAAGDVTDGAGNTLSAVAASVPVIAVETKTLATSVNVSANSTTSSYNIPTKSGYTIAAVTPMVTGSYNGQYFAAITTSDNNVPTSLYFKNTHSSAHTNSFYIRVVYIKN